MVIRKGDRWTNCDDCPFVSECPYYEFPGLESCDVLQVGESFCIVRIMFEDEPTMLIQFFVPAEHRSE